MSYVSLGDMAQTFQLRRQNVELQRSMQRLSAELTTGTKADLPQALGGDLTTLVSLDRSLATLESYGVATAEASLFAGTLQAALGTVQDLTDDIAPSLAAATNTASATQIDTVARDAASRFQSTVAAMNTQAAGRYLLSGAATDTAPLASADDILAALRTATAGQTTVAGIVATVDSWFDAAPGSGGFRDTGFTGTTVPTGPFRIGEGQSAAITATAADSRIVDALKGFALAALVADGALGADVAGRGALTRLAGTRLASASGGIVALRADIGGVEARIAAATTRNTAAATTLQMARNGLVSADPYDTATALEKVQTQIESVYTLTARLSRLSLTDFLR